jgi:hypothetical protein
MRHFITNETWRRNVVSLWGNITDQRISFRPGRTIGHACAAQFGRNFASHHVRGERGRIVADPRGRFLGRPAGGMEIVLAIISHATAATYVPEDFTPTKTAPIGLVSGAERFCFAAAPAVLSFSALRSHSRGPPLLVEFLRRSRKSRPIAQVSRSTCASQTARGLVGQYTVRVPSGEAYLFFLRESGEAYLERHSTDARVMLTLA